MSVVWGSLVHTAARKMEVTLYIHSHLVGHEISPLFGNHKWQFSGTAATHDPSMVTLSRYSKWAQPV